MKFKNRINTMRQTYKIVFAVMILTGISSCASNGKLSESVITPLSDKIGVTEGSLVYGLPLTVLDVTVEAERIIEKPGPYARFAESLLGLKDVIQNEREYWLLTGVSVKSHEEPDPDGFYVIETSSLVQTNALSLKKTGLIMDLNPRLFDGHYGSISTIHPDMSRTGISDLGSDEYFQTRRDTAFRLVKVDTAFIRIPYLVEKRQKLTIEDLAGKAAVRLMEMRDGKYMILTGEANVFPQDEAAISEINRIEKEYTELFTGKTWNEKRIFTYHLNPLKDQANMPLTVCRFTERDGPVDPAVDTGTPLLMEFSPAGKTKGLKILSADQTDSGSRKYDKLFFRMPDVVDIKILFGNEALTSSRTLIYQFGEIVQLPSNYIIGK